MPLFQVIILAVVQGLTEFLPVSSTAHLYLTSWLLGWTDPGLGFDIALHIGTLLAVILYFFRDWLQIIGQGFGIRRGSDDELRQNHMLLWLLVIGTIPVGIAGLLFNKQAEGPWRNAYVIGAMMIVIGVLMWIAENVARKQRDLASVTAVDAVSIGAAQALAVVPGTSRSGVTISAGLFRNLSHEAAARFSFLLSTPAIAAAAGKDVYEMYKNHELHTLAGTQYLVGIGVSAITGCLVIAWFLHYLRRAGLRPFVYYRIALGLFIVIKQFTQ